MTFYIIFFNWSWWEFLNARVFAIGLHSFVNCPNLSFQLLDMFVSRSDIDSHIFKVFSCAFITLSPSMLVTLKALALFACTICLVEFVIALVVLYRFCCTKVYVAWDCYYKRGLVYFHDVNRLNFWLICAAILVEHVEWEILLFWLLMNLNWDWICLPLITSSLVIGNSGSYSILHTWFSHECLVYLWYLLIYSFVQPYNRA